MTASALSRFAFLALALASTIAATGCAVEDERPAPSGTGYVMTEDEEPTDFVEPVGACTPGAIASCRIQLPSHGDVEHCVVADKVCGEDGTWGACGDVPENFAADGEAPEDEDEDQDEDAEDGVPA